MDQFDLVKHFNEDVDSILVGKPKANRKEAPAEYDNLLNLAAVLATDLIPENGKQQILRRQLMNRCLAKNTARNNKEAIMKNFFGKHRPALLAGSFAMVALLGFYLIFPGSLTAMAKGIGNILKLGPYVTIIQADNTAPVSSNANPLTSEQQAQLDKNGYVEFTDKDGNPCIVGTWGKPPVDTVNYSNLADAQQGVSYKLLAPTYLPKGYSFKNAECYKGSQDYITLNFKGSGKDIILMQRLMNEQTKYELGTGGKIEPVIINGNNGAWDDLILIWNIGDVNYTLIANGCSRDEVKKIAESVK